ncbi:MAG: hypothetical protein JKX76_15500 [Colwellia sp.]|nr:hypothetical protein [Colwellia sp.]
MLSAAILSGFFISPSVSVSTTDFVWSKGSGPTENYSPNVLSELEYSDLKAQGYGLDIGYMYRIKTGLYLYSEISRSDLDIKGGEVRDSDWAGNNKTDEFSRSTSKVKDEGISSMTYELGIQTRIFGSPDHYITFLIGEDSTDINLVMTDGVQDIWNPELIGLEPSEFGPGDAIVGLNSTYDAEFSSNFFGLKTEHVFSWGTISLTAKKYDIKYEAKANWNLREEFAHPVSFRHESDGNGMDIEVGYSYLLSDNWDLFIEFSHRKWDIDSGYDQIFFGDGQSVMLRFNGAELNSESYTIGTKYYF